MKKLNDTQNSPLRFEDGVKTIGQFYNSVDGMYHLAEYTPYRVPPSEYLCGKYGNFSPSRLETERNLCPICWEHFKDS